MAVPILLVTGFLGAGKTTAVNEALAQAGGRRIAAVVNDFGAINIDAELIAGAADGVVSLANGCICCTLEGDLLRTLAGLLRRAPRPEAIVIETSGAADPAGVIRNLMDPVVWREAPLETVLCVVDGAVPERLDDALCRAQLGAADIVLLTKLDLAGPGAREAVGHAVRAVRPGATVVDGGGGALPMALLFPGVEPVRREMGRRHPVSDRFESTSWSAARPVSLARLQAAINRLAPRLARAKGLFVATEYPGRALLLQFAGGRAIVGPTEARVADGAAPVRLVFIYEIGRLSEAEIAEAMTGCLPE